jgi:hypothetical protein
MSETALAKYFLKHKAYIKFSAVSVFITFGSIYYQKKIEIIILCCFLNEDRKNQALAITIPRVYVLVFGPASRCMCP